MKAIVTDRAGSRAFREGPKVEVVERVWVHNVGIAKHMVVVSLCAHHLADG